MSEPTSSPSDTAESERDRADIRRLVEDWVVHRDGGDWAAFAAVWHPDGWMTATWFQGPAAEFIRVSQDAAAAGTMIQHVLGGFGCDIDGDRAVARTRMHILQRAVVHGVLVDVDCTGWFHDFVERRNGRWAIVRRQPVYEKDRMDPVTPGETVALDRRLLTAFPEGYRHLAYLQAHNGHQVADGLPGRTGPALDQLRREAAEWLAGSRTAGVSAVRSAS